jgi:small subunit ribosomal protein S17
MENAGIEKKHLFRGKVISKKMSKTATVLFERTFVDKTVKKIVMKRKKFHVHDPFDQAAIGDEITFYDGPHISKIKYMHLAEVIKSAKKNMKNEEAA